MYVARINAEIKSEISAFFLIELETVIIWRTIKNALPSHKMGLDSKSNFGANKSAKIRYGSVALRLELLVILPMTKIAMLNAKQEKENSKASG